MSFTQFCQDFDAVLFDLDGVITGTASVHAVSWKKLFDGYLKDVSTRDGTALQTFEIDTDYRQFVDGRPRYDGVQSFLLSRDIDLPWGTPDDEPGTETVCGLGNAKNTFFNDAVREQGVDVFPSSVALLHRLRAADVRTAVVTSSKNGGMILDVTGLTDLFDTRFDGHDAAETGLAGKPAPDTYLEAARRLGVEASRAVVVEDAISGVEAGRIGKFGLVVGVDRDDVAEALLKNGADLVVGDLDEWFD